MMLQQGDVKLFQTNDGGEITVENGVVEMGGGLETAAYLSMFGGNEDDDGLQDNAFDWWGNLDETEPSRKYRSETQNLLQSLPLTTSNLRRIEDAATRDLKWFTEENVATSVEVLASIPALNTVKITINIDADITIEFIENWKAAS